VQQPGVHVKLGWHWGGDGRHHAAHDARGYSVVQRCEQQAAATSAGETERSQPCGINTGRRRKDSQRRQIVGQHGARKRLAERTGSLRQSVFVQPRDQIEPFVVARVHPKLLPKSVLGSNESREPRRRGGEIKSSATPREGVVHEYGVTLTSQVVGRSTTRVIVRAKPHSTRVRVRTTIDELLTADRADAAMAMQTQYAGQAATYACRTQQPSSRIWPVTERPPKSANLDSIQALASLIVDGRCTAGLSQPEYPTQRGARRVEVRVRLGGSYGCRPVLIACNRIRAVDAPLVGVRGQLGTPPKRAGPVLARLSIRGRSRTA
jgi:hypothetical protein